MTPKTPYPVLKTTEPPMNGIARNASASPVIHNNATEIFILIIESSLLLMPFFIYVWPSDKFRFLQQIKQLPTKLLHIWLESYISFFPPLRYTKQRCKFQGGRYL